MSEEKDLFQEENTLNNEAEDMLQAEQAVESQVDDVAEEDDFLKNLVEGAEIPEKKKISKPAVAVISSLITLVVCAAIVFVAGYFIVDKYYNPYNANVDGYIDTLDDLAESSGKTVDDLKKEFGLPEDMEGNTYVAAAECYIPLGVFFQMQGMSADMIPIYAQMMGIEGEIDENMPYGKFIQLQKEAAKKQQEEAAKQETAPVETPAEAPSDVADAPEGNVEAPTAEVPAEEAPAAE